MGICLRFAILCSFAVLAACGGGGGGGGGTPNDGVPTETAATAIVPLTVSASVPANVKDSIAEYLTPASSASASDTVEVPTATGSKVVVLALDTHGDIRLAGMATQTDARLDETTTALALVHLALGIEQSTDPAIDEAAIQASANFGGLVSSIVAAGAQGISPVASAEVLAEVRLVTTDAVQSSALSAITTSNGRKARQEIAKEHLSGGLPFKVQLKTGPLSVMVAGVALNGDLQLLNTTPIAWASNSTTYAGLAVPALPATKDGNTLLPAASARQVLTGKVLPILALDSVSVPADSGRNISLTVGQTPVSRATNVTEIVSELFALALADLGEKQASAACRLSLVSAFLDVNSLSAMPESADGKVLRDYLMSLKIADLKEVLTKCDPTAPRNWGTGIGRYVVTVAKYLSGLAEVGSVVSAASLVGKVVYTAKYWGIDAATVGICETSTVLGPVVVNCTASFSFDPPAPILAVGAVYSTQKTLTALDADERKTGVPSALNFSQDDGGAVVQLDPTTGDFVAKGIGITTIRVGDPSTGAAGSYPVRVVDPVVTPASTGVKIGDSVALHLEDGSGGILNAASGTTWASSDPTVAAIDPVLSLLTYPEAVLVTGKSIGTARIVATNSITGKSTSATVLVTGDVTFSFEDRYVPRHDPICTTTSWFDTTTRTNRTYGTCTTQPANDVRATCTGKDCETFLQRYYLYQVPVVGACLLTRPGPVNTANGIVWQPFTVDGAGFSGNLFVGVWSQTTYGLPHVVYNGGDLPTPSPLLGYEYLQIDCQYDVFVVDPGRSQTLLERRHLTGGW